MQDAGLDVLGAELRGIHWDIFSWA
jgi:hypothetical protein